MKKATIILFVTTFFAHLSQAQETNKILEINKIPSSLPDFPKYINTGNPIEDNLNYSKEKQNWIAMNPRAYETILNAVSVDMLPGFPQKVKTGNTDLDDLFFKKAKDDWYQAYPEMLHFFYDNNSKKYSNIRD